MLPFCHGETLRPQHRHPPRAPSPPTQSLSDNCLIGAHRTNIPATCGFPGIWYLFRRFGVASNDEPRPCSPSSSMSCLPHTRFDTSTGWKNPMTEGSVDGRIGDRSPHPCPQLRPCLVISPELGTQANPFFGLGVLLGMSLSVKPLQAGVYNLANFVSFLTIRRRKRGDCLQFSTSPTCVFLSSWLGFPVFLELSLCSLPWSRHMPCQRHAAEPAQAPMTLPSSAVPMALTSASRLAAKLQSIQPQASRAPGPTEGPCCRVDLPSIFLEIKISGYLHRPILWQVALALS